MGINENQVGTPSQELTAKAHELQKAGAIVARLIVTGTTTRFVASGQCPGCGGHFSIDRPSDIVVVRSDVPPVDVVVCNVPAADGTPEGKVGCGACFSVYAPVAPSLVGGK